VRTWGLRLDAYFTITFRDATTDAVHTLRARRVADSTLGLGFIAVSDFLFDTTSRIVNPEEESLRRRFENVRSLHLSIHRVLEIQEVGVEHEGLKLDADRSKLIPFPTKD
jgi:hypothetical protein